jgi:hypothetical protein
MINHQEEELKDSLRWNLRGIEVPFFPFLSCSIESYLGAKVRLRDQLGIFLVIVSSYYSS